MARSSRSRQRVREAPPSRSLPAPSDMVLAVFVVSAVLLGGASAAGLVANLALQLAALAILFLLAIRPAHRPAASSERWLWGIGAAFVLVALIQLVPLPPSVWTSFPQRAPIVAEFRLLDVPLPWLPISLDPHAGLYSLLSVVVFAASAALVLRQSDTALTLFAWALGVVAGISVLLGFVQLASGGNSPLYFYTITNRDQPVGFFANSNHLATLLVAAIPMLVALAVARRNKDDQAQGRAGLYVILGGLAALLLLGAITNGSLAGLLLIVPTLIGCFLLVRRVGRRVALVAVGLAQLLFGGFLVLAINSPILSGFANTAISAAPTSRLGFIQNSLNAFAAYFPLGSGLGSFQAVYPAFEDPDLVSTTYVNHAHSDYVEFILEMGLAGVLLVLAFLGWWIWRALTIWRDPESSAMARAATISTAAILAHSVVDYPLRTAAIAAVFAACCAIMARPGRAIPPPPISPQADLPVARHLSA